MGKKVSWWALVASLAATLVLGGLGCGEMGKVDQGRVIAFEDIRLSSRHRSGFAVRFPRIARWRTDKTVAGADTLLTIKALLHDAPQTA